ncbi:MAG TPA: tetratricopeptide repeat protein [Vicinamibacterales bacterium]|nr:tetratricopeptide repeat protein [Vicinamibacterales bacterium]
MLYLLATLLLAVALQATASQAVDPALQNLVNRFFETQQTEDVEGYLALWSSKAARPTAEQLKFVFASGDDTFLDVSISQATVSGDSARLRVTATRVRTDLRVKNPDGGPRMFSTRLQLGLSLVREDGSWKIFREGAPADELAAALIDTPDAAARRAILESEPALANARLVEAIARRADNLAQMREYRKAQEMYERSLEVAEAIGDRKAEGQAIQNIANALYFQRDYPAALGLYERRLAIERETGNDEGIASALLGVATIKYSTYEYGPALQTYREALAIQERLDDDLLVSTTLISTGNVLYLQGDYEAAIADYRRAEALKRKYFDLGGAATALEGLGRVYSAQGDFAAALGAFAEVLEERRKRNDVPRQAVVLQSIGETHFRLGNTDQARTAFEASRKHFESAKDTGRAGRVLQGAALNELVAGRFGAGEKAYAESITLCTGAADQVCVAGAQVGLAFALAAQRKYDEAITWYGKSLISFNTLRMEEPAARVRIGLAEALLGKGEHARALDEAVSARRTAIALASDDVLWRALVSEARAERKLGRPAPALGAARAALLAVRRMSAAALERPGHAVPRDTTAAYATTAVLQAEAGDAAAAFQTAEEMRAHALRISLAANERDIARGMTEDERAVERKLSSELTPLIARRDRQKELPKPDAAEIEKLDGAIAEMGARRSAAREALFGRLPELQVWRGLGPAATLDDLAILLEAEGQVLLQFVVDEHDLVVITGVRSRFFESAGPKGLADSKNRDLTPAAHVVAIERQELAERIARALDGRALASAEAWRQASAELFQILPAAVVERLTAATSVIVVPDDLLWRVPFEALPVGTQFLADRASISYAASVAAAVRAPAAPRPGLQGPIITVHSPELPAPVVEALKSTAPSWVIRVPESATAEVAGLGKVSSEYPPVILSGSAATKQGLRTAAASVRADPAQSPGALHIAAPFRVNSASPLFSPILLAAAMKDAGTGLDGSELEMRELFNFEPLASVVMLTDPAALSKRDAAAAVVPVHWAWRSTGATTLILRRWGGEDDMANEVIVRFYEELRAGKPPRQALDVARAAVRTAAAGRPAAWAGWLLLSGS